MTPGTTILGKTTGGVTVHRVTIAGGALSASILTLGVALQDVRLKGTAHSLTVGSPELEAYETAMEYCGTIVGPVGNRIGGASAVIDCHRCTFDANLHGKHTLHGGRAGTHKQIWEISDTGLAYAEFHLSLPDGGHGFPGDRILTARYEVHDDTLWLTLTAKTDAPTLMNLANHSYWRLAGTPTYAGHQLQVAAERYLPSTAVDFLPTGEILPVDKTRFDFRQRRALDPETDGLWDNNFCISYTRQPLRPVAKLTGPTGLRMEMSTTEPGLQVFDGHILDIPNFASNDGPATVAYAGLALEAQFWLDAPNNPEFPSIVLRPKDTWQQTTSWRFSQQ